MDRAGTFPRFFRDLKSDYSSVTSYYNISNCYERAYKQGVFNFGEYEVDNLPSFLIIARGKKDFSLTLNNRSSKSSCLRNVPLKLSAL